MPLVLLLWAFLERERERGDTVHTPIHRESQREESEEGRGGERESSLSFITITVTICRSPLSSLCKPSRGPTYLVKASFSCASASRTPSISRFRSGSLLSLSRFSLARIAREVAICHCSPLFWFYSPIILLLLGP